MKHATKARGVGEAGDTPLKSDTETHTVAQIPKCQCHYTYSMFPGICPPLLKLAPVCHITGGSVSHAGSELNSSQLCSPVLLYIFVHTV